MAHNTIETDIYETNVVVPDSGDNATAVSVETGLQDVANRTKFLLAHLAFLSSLDNTTGSRSALNGAKHIRRVTSIANLQAIVGGAGLNGECAVVDALGLYIYSSADATAADGNWIVAPSSGGGRWRHVLQGLLNAAQGLPRLDASTKIPAAQVPGRLVGVSELNTGLTTLDDGTTWDTETSASFQDLGGGGDKLNVVCAVGDILVIDAMTRAKHPSGRGEIGLKVAGTRVVEAPVYGSNALPVSFKYTHVAAGTSVEIMFQGRSVSGADILSLYRPTQIRCQIFRP